MKKKLLSVFMIMILLLNIMPLSIIYATDITEDDLQAMVDLIPDEMTLDIPEIEYEQSSSLVEQNVKEIWESNNIDLDAIEASGTTITYTGSVLRYTSEFYEATIKIVNTDLEFSKTTTIALTYSNHDGYNLEDEEYVESIIDIPNDKWYEIDLEDYKEMSVTDVTNTLGNQAVEYYEELISNIGDESLDIAIYYTTSYNGDFNNGIDIYIGIFKDGILYSISDSSEFYVPAITIPSSISDDELSDYILSIIKENRTYLGGHPVYSISEGTLDIYVGLDVPDAWTASTGSSPGIGLIIAHREISLADEETDVKLDATTPVVSKDVVLSVELITDEETLKTIENVLTNVSQFTPYDITLLVDGVEVQPNGNVTISIKIPDGYNTSALVVYRIDEDGTQTEYEVTVDDGYAVFETDHFSTYILAETEDESDYLKGDVNGDGDVTLTDYAKVLAHVKKTQLLTGDELERADVNEDGKVTLTDYALILAHVKKTKLLY